MLFFNKAKFIPGLIEKKGDSLGSTLSTVRKRGFIARDGEGEGAMGGESLRGNIRCKEGCWVI